MSHNVAIDGPAGAGKVPLQSESPEDLVIFM